MSRRKLHTKTNGEVVGYYVNQPNKKWRKNRDARKSIQKASRRANRNS